MEFSIGLIIAGNSRKSRATLYNFVQLCSFCGARDRTPGATDQRTVLGGESSTCSNLEGMLHPDALSRASAPLIDPIVWARGWFFLVFVDVDLEALAVAFVLPVSDRVADVVEERTAAEVEIANKHAPEMADVAYVVSAGA